MLGLPESKAIKLVSWLAIVTGAWVIISWLLHLPSLETYFPQYVSMRFNTGICLLFTGGALQLTQTANNKKNALFFYLLAIGGALFSALSLSQNVFNFNAGIDELLVKDIFAAPEKYRWPGRMAANVSFCFLVTNLALIGTTLKSRPFNILSQYLLHLVTAISVIAIVGYLYAISLFYTLSAVGSMAVHTAILFLLISISATLLQPSLGITKLFTGDLVGNQMAKRLFVIIVLMVVVFGEVRMLGEQYQLVPAQLGFPLLALCFLLVSLVVIAYTARWLNRLDSKRYEAEEELTVMNEELEERVQERSAELLNLLDKFRESESKFRAAFEHSGIGMALVSMQGEWIKVNERLCDLLGYTEQELLSMTIMDVTHPDDMAVTVGTLEIAAAGKKNSYRIEKRYIQKNGAVIWASINMSTVPDEHNEPMYLVNQIEDITGRKKIDARFRTIVESVFVGIKLNDANGNIIYRSPSMRLINGWTDEEMDRNYFLLAHPDDLELIEDIHQKVLANPDKSFSIIYRILHKDGHYIWIESLLCNKLADAELAAIITVTRDITDTKRAEEKIVHEKVLSETVIESLPEVFYLRDTKGHFLRWNKNFERVTGYTAEEVNKLVSVDMVIPEDRELARKQFESMQEHGTATIQARVALKDGTKVPFLIFNTAIRYENQDCVVGVAIDISARLRAEEELRSSEHKYKLLFESNPLPMWMIAKDDLSIIAANKAAERLYGYTKDELLQMKVSRLRHPDDQLAQTDDWQKEFHQNDDQRIVKHIKKDGSAMFVQIIAHDIIFEGRQVRLSFTNDVTDKIAAEETLKKSEANLKTIMDATDNAYILMDDKLNIMAHNPMAVTFANRINGGHLKGNAIGDYFSGEQLEQFTGYSEDVLNGRSISYEISYPEPEGPSVLWYYIRLFPITNEKNNILGLMLAISDISERRNAEESLKTAYTLIQAHIESIREMAWKQSHLVRSPVANLKGLVAMLETDHSNLDVQKFISMELERLDQIIIEMAEDASTHD